ncbi:MAG: ABC transporter ATP-binding protein [Peptococcaceae bacterium]|nr:ABC transporter ATP-binding protein [Peptococcaceae bacterium]
MLEIENLMVFFENALAVNDLSLTVGRGEIVGIFGSNSAGKTTLMNTVAGLTLHLKNREQRKGGIRITIAGRVKFNGEDIQSKNPTERVKMGLVLCRERHPVFRDNTVEENLKLGGYLRKDREVKESMDFVYDLFPPLKRLKGKKAGMLSGGEQEMVAIGMALTARPALLLMDEPLLGLSPAMQKEVVRAVKTIREQGVTILLSEQYARPIMPVIDRGYVIENGTLVVSGTGKELMDNPEVKAAYFGM